MFRIVWGKALEGAQLKEEKTKSRRKTTRRLGGLQKQGGGMERDEAHYYLRKCKTVSAARGAFNRIDSQLFRPLSTSIF